MPYIKRVLRVVLSGTGFLFVPLLLLSVLWGALFLAHAGDVGFPAAARQMWTDAALLKAAWFLGGVRGLYRTQRGCQE